MSFSFDADPHSQDIAATLELLELPGQLSSKASDPAATQSVLDLTGGHPYATQDPLSGDYRRRHSLPGPSTVQRAIGSLQAAEVLARRGGETWISEPFLAEWLLRNEA